MIQCIKKYFNFSTFHRFKISLKIKNLSEFNYVVIHTANNEQWFIDFENIAEPIWADEKI